ncbi:hypothetical protein QBC38DRAFT_368969 [Podospora fimiseda]|uniref:Ste12 interacting protein n=1 Tax=Podospora fimiseda TaxID=252190 RepID=A0AAN7BL70_9PEZI|nr:hypothetical protein QBC38DRAFT_368969 [Podospora fimiseda]
MSPTYTMSAHLCKQIYSSWRQTRQSSPDPLPSPPTNTFGSYFPQSQQRSSLEKRSMDNGDRHDTSPSSSPNSRGNWKWGSR